MNGISVIVPSYNSFKTIGRTVEGLLAQTVRADEILIVDSSRDSQTPPILDRLEKESAGAVRVIRLKEKTMPAPGRNLGAREARGKLLAFIDSDAYPDPDWLEKIAAANTAGCRVGGGSIALPPFQKSHRLATAQFFLQFNEFMDVGARRPARFTPSCNLFCEKALFEEVGGFPDIRASEDVLFGLRAGRLAQYWFVPEARVNHIFREDWRPFLDNQELLGRYVFLYRRAEEKKFYTRGAWPVVFLPGFLAVKIARITARVFSSRPETAARYLWCLPEFLAGLFFWAKGFLSGSLAPREGAG